MIGSMIWKEYREQRSVWLALAVFFGVLLYGATEWLFMRSLDDPLDFTQFAVFPEGKTQFERYWYSEEISEARAAASGYYQVPILPVFFRVAGAGELVPEEALPSGGS